MHMRWPLGRLFWLGAALAAALAGCLEDDDSEGEDGNDTGNGDATGDAGNDTTSGDTGELNPELVVGHFVFVSTTLQGRTITTENQDIFGTGTMTRGDGTLDLDLAGTYTLVLQFYTDDVLDEEETESGTWWTETDAAEGRVWIQESGQEAEVAEYIYVTETGTMTLTRVEGEPSLDVDQLVVQRLTR